MTRSPLASALALPAPLNLPSPEIITPSGPTIDYKYQEPDEKLFEALESPKDRLFLLRLEQEVISFVKDSQYVLATNTSPKSTLTSILENR